MHVALTHPERRQLAALSEAFVSPLAASRPEAWREAVDAGLRQAFGCDHVMFVASVMELHGLVSWCAAVGSLSRLSNSRSHESVTACKAVSAATSNEARMFAVIHACPYREYILLGHVFKSFTQC